MTQTLSMPLSRKFVIKKVIKYSPKCVRDGGKKQRSSDTELTWTGWSQRLMKYAFRGDIDVLPESLSTSVCCIFHHMSAQHWISAVTAKATAPYNILTWLKILIYIYFFTQIKNRYILWSVHYLNGPVNSKSFKRPSSKLEQCVPKNNLIKRKAL